MEQIIENLNTVQQTLIELQQTVPGMPEGIQKLVVTAQLKIAIEAVGIMLAIARMGNG